MSAADILKLIEAVDPSDTSALDEIDARVWCWLNKYPADDLVYAGSSAVNDVSKVSGNGQLPFWREYSRHASKYTSSRDALKAIRPDGWVAQIRPLERIASWSYVCDMQKPKLHGSRQSSALPTEELAELHATIQVINHERTQSGR